MSTHKEDSKTWTRIGLHQKFCLKNSKGEEMVSYTSNQPILVSPDQMHWRYADPEVDAAYVREINKPRTTETLNDMTGQMSTTMCAKCESYEVCDNKNVGPPPCWDDADAHVRRLEAENERLLELISRDGTGLANALDNTRKLLRSYSWLGEPDVWGSYSYEDQHEGTLRKELASMLDDIEKVSRDAMIESGHRVNVAFHSDRDIMEKLWKGIEYERDLDVEPEDCTCGICEAVKNRDADAYLKIIEEEKKGYLA